LAAGAAPVETPSTGEVCQVSVTASATDVAIFIDGRRRGIAPTTLQLPCEPTVLRLQHLHNRYVDQTRSVTPTTHRSLHVVMPRPQGLLKVVSRPGGATVRLNGRDVGKTPLLRKVEAFETMTVTLRAAGMVPERRRVYPKAGTTVVAATLKKQ